MSCFPRSPWSRSLLVVPALSLLACGDDAPATLPSDGSGGADMTTTSTTGGEAGPSTTEGSNEGTSSTTTASVDDSTTSGVDDTASSSESSSSTGVPNELPETMDDFYLTNTATRSLMVAAANGLLANDSDPEGGALMVSDFSASSDAGGTVTVEDDGSFIYVPPTPFWGEDAFLYTVQDPLGGTTQGRVRVAVAPTEESLGDVVDATAGMRISGPTDDDRLGSAVAGGADVNGDGFADIVFGAEDALADERGAAYVVFGGPDAANVDGADVEAGTGGFAILGPAGASSTGYSVAMLGDVNGDGLGDVAVGVTDGGGPGGVFVVFGQAAPTTVDLDALGTGGFSVTGGNGFGRSISGAGDVNDDGLQDVVIGDPTANSDAGAAVVVFGKADTDSVDGTALGTAGFRIDGTTAGGVLGSSVAGAGDVNGDGFDDVVIGAQDDGTAGRVFVVYGKADTAGVSEDDFSVDVSGGFSVSGAIPVDLLGRVVAGAGDVNGDGLADIVFGGPGLDAGGENASGRTYVLFGGADLQNTTLTELDAGVGGIAWDGASQFDLSGWAVGGGGDLDRDGYDDVIVSAQGVDLGASNAGRIYVFYGGPDLASSSLGMFPAGDGGFALDGEGLQHFAAWAVHGSADANGDGFDDVAFGVPEAAGDAGLGYVAFGGNYTGTDLRGFTSEDDTITGSEADETLVGGRGHDELISGGGADVVSGGAGDDVLAIVDGGFRRLDGGAGVDTLRLDGGGFQLDLENFFDVAITDIEVVDLTGDGDNGLFLGTHQLLALSSTSNTVRVHGDAGDMLVADLAGAGFVDEGSDGSATTYSNGIASLVVDDAVSAFVSLE